MGVYIKGMEMPKGKRGKRIIIFPNGAVVELIAEYTYDGDLHTVKAVPVPTHGRLIDADALMRHKGDCYDADGYLLYAVGTGNILCAPTVIPAEEETT